MSQPVGEAGGPASAQSAPGATAPVAPADAPADAKAPEPAADLGRKRRRRRKKQKRDPLAPQRPLSGFMYFGSAMRPIIIKEHGLLPRQIGPIGRLLGKKWKALDAAGKAPYLARAAADKARYAREMDEYRNLLLERERVHALRNLRDATQTQRAVAAAAAANHRHLHKFTPYMAYVQKVRPRLIAAHPRETLSQIGLRLGLGWDRLRHSGLVRYRNVVDPKSSSVINDPPPLWKGRPSRYAKAARVPIVEVRDEDED